jgi:hypothetical protein
MATQLAVEAIVSVEFPDGQPTAGNYEPTNHIVWIRIGGVDVFTYRTEDYSQYLYREEAELISEALEAWSEQINGKEEEREKVNADS